MAVRDEIKEQTDKFKDMTRDQKIDYIWTYYRWWILGTLLVLFIIVSTVKTVIGNSKPVYLYASFLNSTVEASGTNCTLDEAFEQKYNIDRKAYNDSFDYVIYLNDDYGSQQSMAGQMKILSYYSAEQVDIICAEESVLNGPADVGGYGNLEEILPGGMLDELISKGYEPYYYTEKFYEDDSIADENGNRPYTAGKTYIGGIYIDNCKKLVGTDSTCVYDKASDDRRVLAIGWNTNNLEHAIEFIKFVTE